MAGFGRTVVPVIVALVCWAWAPVSWCYPTGAPSTACSDLTPGHGSNTPQQGGADGLFTITVDKADFLADETLTVTLSAFLGLSFKGVLLQARLVNTSTPVGQFQNLPSDLQPLSCSTSDSSVTHSDSSEKQTAVVEWAAPSNPTGDIEFVATFVFEYSVFWTHVKSPVIPVVTDPCSPDPCFNNFPCFTSNDKRSFFCACDSPYTSPLCEGPCDPNPCQNGGICDVRDTSFICLCPVHTAGTLCEETCPDNYCKNGGTCSPLIGQGLYCSCPIGFSGPTCEESLLCQPNLCQNGGICTDSTPSGTTKYSCRCPVNFMGDDCEIPAPCNTQPCMNGGSCVQADGTLLYTCDCADGFLGDNCEISNPCAGEDNPCLNRGTCFQSSSVNDNYFCSCSDGFTGDHCETQITMDPCSSDPCENDGVCTAAPDGSSSFECTCQPAFFGQSCQSRGACFSVTCSDHGTCVAAEDQTGYTCQCDENYDGNDCQYIDACLQDNPCQQGSTCLSQGQGQLECQCPPWLAGGHCELDVTCLSTPCTNGGTCVSGGDGTFQCNCRPTYSGPDCGVYTDPCAPNPCLNGGNCNVNLTLASGRECICSDFYSGVNCENYSGDSCDTIVCLNGGDCISTSPSPTCVCTDEYSGMSCETKLTPTISDCPDGSTATFSLQPGTDTAQIDLSITAMDSQGRSLALTVTDGLAFPGPLRYAEEYRAGREISVEARDADGRLAVCTFTLRLDDTEKPVVTCPADVSEITTGNSAAVSFPLASAADNLAVEGALLYSHASGSDFAVGATSVIVEAEDTFGNKGECKFTVTVHKKASDCLAFTGPVNGQVACAVNQDQRRCTIACNEGFGNAIGDYDYMCQYRDTAFWDPRPNTDICIAYRAGNGVSKEVTLKFAVPEEVCTDAGLEQTESSLMATLRGLGACGTSAECELSLSCASSSDGSGARRRRLLATAELTAEVELTVPAVEGDIRADVRTQLDAAVEAVTDASDDGLLTVAASGGETIANDPSALEVSTSDWNCNSGQISDSDGCLSCPPGTFHDAESNRCVYCPLSTYQNKPEQGSCLACPKDSQTQQEGAFSVDQCGAQSEKISSPWTPTLIGIVGGAGGLIVLLVLVLVLVFTCRSCGGRDEADKEGPLHNLTHLNQAYEADDCEMQFHGGPSLTSDTTYQNVLDDENDRLDSGSTDHLVRIPSLSQYSDYYATLNARSAPALPEKGDSPPSSPPPPPPVPAPEPPVIANGGPLPPPPPPIQAAPPAPPAPHAPPAPPAPPALNANNSNKSKEGSGAKFLV